MFHTVEAEGDVHRVEAQGARVQLEQGRDAQRFVDLGRGPSERVHQVGGEQDESHARRVDAGDVTLEPAA